jgi:aminoglycoside phosphotransferase (APT) family kinase protein
MALSTDRDLAGSRDRLQHWLGLQLPDGAGVEITELVTPRTGYSGEMLLFDARWSEGGAPRSGSYVARLQPAGETIFPDVDLQLHYRVLRALEATAVRAPRALWFQRGEDSPLDEPFFVMERLPGRVPPEHPPYTVRGWFADASPADRARACVAAIEQLAVLHQADWTTLDLDFLPTVAAGRPGMDAELGLFEDYLDWVLADRDVPLLRQAFDWLRVNVPASDRLCLNWGDAKLSNILYEGVEPTGLLDWELATVAPPEADVAFWLVFHESITRAKGHPDPAGFPSDDEVVACYETLTGTTLTALPYYRIWQLFRLATISTRLTDMLVQRGKVGPEDPAAPSATPMRLLSAALDA